MKGNRSQMKQIKDGLLSVSGLNIRVFGLPLILSGILFTIASCKKESTDPLTIDKSYFPLETGKYILYDVDSTGYSSFDGSVKVSSYQIKEELDSPFIDNEGNEAYRIIRSRRENDTSAWRTIDIWTANLTDHTAEKVEENLRFIKLDFPVNLSKRWYGNAKIQTDGDQAYLDGWIYEYTSVNAPLTINGLSFDSTVTVLQHDEENLIEQTIYIEQYAKDVGLIYKKEEQLETQPGFPADGFIIEMRVKEFN
jgi:hypothetical protein